MKKGITPDKNEVGYFIFGDAGGVKGAKRIGVLSGAPEGAAALA